MIFLFSLLAQWSIILPTGMMTAILRIKPLESAWRVFGGYLLLSLLSEGISLWLTYHGIRGTALVHVFTWVEFVLLMAYFEQLGIPGFSRRRRNGLMAGFSVFAFYNSIWVQRIDVFNTYSIVTSSLILIGLSLAYFSRGKASQASFTSVLYQGEFWIVTAILLYNAANLFFFLGLNLLDKIEDREAFQLIWLFCHSLPLLLRNLLFSVGLWTHRNKS